MENALSKTGKDNSENGKETKEPMEPEKYVMMDANPQSFSYGIPSEVKDEQTTDCGMNRIACKEDEGSAAEVNMEALITVDDVIRAGGFGARDDISNFLPSAIDSTDFEASLRDARDFEEPQEQVPRPGLGWVEHNDS